MTDLVISGNSCSINCYTSRFDTQNYSIILETWMKKADYQSLRDSIRVGAVGELGKIGYFHRFYDGSFSGANTISLIPVAGSNLSTMKGKKVVFVKSISSVPVKGPNLWLNIKMEVVVSGNVSL